MAELIGVINEKASLIGTINYGNRGPKGDKGDPGSQYQVSVSATGTSTNEVSYITIDGVESKLVGGGSGTSDFNELNNRPSYNGTVMNNTTNIPEIKTANWDAKSVVSGTNDGNNWQTITIDGTTMNVPQGTSSSDIFIAEYGVTTHAEVLAAYNAGKFIIVKHQYEGVIHTDYYILSCLDDYYTFFFFKFRKLNAAGAVPTVGFNQVRLRTNGWTANSPWSILLGIPEPSLSGTYTLKCINGTYSWVSE